jgi:hypothetical protein
VSKRTVSPGLGSLGSGAVTAVALAVQTGLAAVVGVLIAHKFGRTTQTDGFFAAYGLFVVLALVATSARIVVLPSLARSRLERRLGKETTSYALSFAWFALPLVLVSVFASWPIATALTGFGPHAARHAAASVLPWMVGAAVGQFYAGLFASALAAMDQYVVSAAAYGVGSVAGLLVIVWRVDADGIAAIGWGMALNACICVALQTAWLAWRASKERMPAGGMLPVATSRRRLTELARGVCLPLSLQGAYVICLAFAAREGVGEVTSFGYAFLIGSALVAVTAGSLGLVTSVPVTRAGLDPAGVAHHVDSSSWLALVGVTAATGVFALAGGRVVNAFLGSGYQAHVGAELGRLVVAFAPWMVASIGISIAFPLIFIQARLTRLPVYAVGLVALHLPLSAIGQAVAGLYGLAVALALTTAIGLTAILVDLHAARVTLAGLVAAAAAVALIGAAAFVPLAFLLPPAPAAILGVFVFGGLLAVVRPPGLRRSWRYLRSLG